MNIFTTIALSVATISALAVASEDAATSTSSVQTAEENTGKGFYVGVGLGGSFYNTSLTKSSYYLYDPDGTYTINGSDLEQLDGSDTGYLLYGGYQFNKIIGVEGSYTDYGTFSSNIGTFEFTQKPQSYAVSANAGYNFFNGQLRPFGLLGIGYLVTNQSDAYTQMKAWDDDFATLHMGIGIEYYPTVLKGFGVRASYTADSYVSDVDTREISTADKVSQTTLWQHYSIAYVGIQYKF